MNFNEIKELIKVVNESELKYFQLNIDDVNITMSKNDNVTVCEKEEQHIQHKNPEHDVPKTEKIETLVNNDKKSGSIIKSPIVGTFYTALSPDKPAFKLKGDSVKKGEVVCIVEAMKIMNEIKSEFDGIVDEVLVENEQIVEFGQPLFRII